ncbi:MAG: ATP-binding protein [Acidilobus sp.]|nr:ATP-binding protein [Acidilobus sp.]
MTEEKGGPGEAFLLRVKGAEDQVEKLDRMLREAYEVAKSIGRVVGRVSRYGEVKVGENARIQLNIDPMTYYGESEAPFHRVGDYLVVVDPKDKRQVLIRVTSIGRRDELSMIGVQPPVSPIVDGLEPRGLITDAVIEGELVLELRPGEESPRPAVKSIEPQAPVVAPSPETLRRLLDLPTEGVTLGSLATPGGLIVGGRIPVRLPVSALLHHVLVVGTTGSGKTTLLKNMLASAYSQLNNNQRFVAVIIDLNEDFVQLPLPPIKEPEPRAVRESAFAGVRPPKGIAIVIPVTAQQLSAAVRGASRGEGGVLESALREVALEYYKEVLSPLTGVETVELRRHVTDGEGLGYFEAQGLGFRLLLFPYVIDTTHSSVESLLALLPGATELVRQALTSVLNSFERKHGVRPPLEVVMAASFMLYMQMRSKGRSTDERLQLMAWDLISKYVVSLTELARTGKPEESAVNFFSAELRLGGSWSGTFEDAVEEVKDYLESLLPHRETMRALFSRLASLLDSGFVDVLYAARRGGTWTIEVLPETPWGSIVSVAHGSEVPVVLDLRWGMERSQGGFQSLRVLAYRLLDMLLAWRHELWSRRSADSGPNVVVFIDEAHQFFPSEGRTKEEAEEVGRISAILSRAARIGRSRGLGLVFSTHTPRDLNNLVIQLTNTKVILRSEESQLDVLSIPAQVRQFAPRLQDRYMAVISYAFREGYVFAVTTTPLTMHFDLSAAQP